MKLRIGDKVRLLNEVGEGLVSRIKDKETVYVEMSDGFEITCKVTEFVPIHTELIIDKDAENIELNPDAHLTDAIYFVIEPDHDFPSLINDYKIYLFNASSFNLLFSYSIKDDVYFQTLKHGEVGPYQKVLIRQVKMQYFNDYHYHKMLCLLYKYSFFKAQRAVAEVLHISPINLQNSNTIEHDQFNYPVYGFILNDQFESQP